MRKRMRKILSGMLAAMLSFSSFALPLETVEAAYSLGQSTPQQFFSMPGSTQTYDFSKYTGTSLLDKAAPQYTGYASYGTGNVSTTASSSASKGLSGAQTTNMAIGAATALIGGVPIGGTTKFSFSSSGEVQSYAVCQTSAGEPEIYEDVTITCACVAVGGWCVPPIQRKSVNYDSGGAKSESFKFPTFRTCGKSICVGALEATVSSVVYEGTSDLGGFDAWGGIGGTDAGGYSDYQGLGNLGDYGFGDYSTNGNINEYSYGSTDFGGGASSDFGGGSSSGFGGDSSSSFGGGGTSADYLSDGSSIKSDGDSSSYGDALNSLLSDAASSFNSADDDFTSSEGGDGSFDMDDYLNGVFGEEDIPDGLTGDGLEEFNDGLSSSGGDDLNGLFADGSLDGTGADGSGVYGENGEYGANGEGGIYGDGGAYADGGEYGDAMRNYAAAMADWDGTGLPPKPPGMSDAEYMRMLMQMGLLGGAGTGSGAGAMGITGANQGSVLSSSSALGKMLGVAAEEGTHSTTMSEQEMYAFAKKWMEKLGISEKEMLSGKTYSRDSAWTEPDAAWDFNRFTTLLKKRKIKAPAAIARPDPQREKPNLSNAAAGAAARNGTRPAQGK